MKRLYFIMFCFLSSGICLSSQTPDSTKYCSLKPSEFQKMYLSEKHALLIDVREPFEIKKGMIKGAVNIPSTGGIDTAADTISKETSLFLYCVSGVRSRRIAIAFYNKGFRKLYSLEGGIVAWRKDGFPLVKGKRKK